ncbi:MAG: adenylate/guanylate cyclase domain-containing protein [Gammaproteobacteria bacterium]|nr:adenylate/guanylate cyclase domain-containing protein [Gammaproteobacteria bacterium]
MAEQPHRELVVILHADVVGSTALVQRNETLAHERIQATFQRLSEIISSHGGAAREIRGDALVAEFARASDAVGASLAFQAANAARNEELPDEIRPVARIGIALGEVVIADGTVTGEGVVLAQRLEQLAEPGGVCMQGAAYETVPKRLPFAYENLGERQVKGFDEPVRVFAVSLQAGATIPGPEPRSRRDAAAPAVAGKLSIAVLPFVNMSGDSEQEYFSDGITEDIITELSRFKNLSVIARNSSFTFKGRSVDVKEVGQKLHVNHVVEGSVRKAGNRVRVTAQLVETTSGKHLWAERYDRSLEDIFAVQDEVASSVVEKLGLSLREAATAHARSRPTEILGAYDHFLRGRAAWWRGDWNEGFVHLERALAADPGFAAAHAWLALQYAYQSFGSTMGFSPERISEKTREHAEAALALDDKDPFVHMAASMAFGFSPRPDKERGLRHSDVSVTLNPHEADVMYCRAYHLAYFGRHEEALEWLDRLRALNPVSTYMLSECYADIYYMMGRYDEAMETFRGQADVPAQVQVVFAACLAQLGRTEDAHACLANMEASRPASFDPSSFINAQIAACARREDAEHWREGFRKAGIPV